MHYDPPCSSRVCTDTILSLKSSQDCQSHRDSGHDLATEIDMVGSTIWGTIWMVYNGKSMVYNGTNG